MSQVLYREVQNGLLSSMTTMTGLQELEYQKSLPETVMYLQIIPPSMMEKSYIIVPLISIVTLIPIVLEITFELCHQHNKYDQLLHSLTI